MLSWVVAGAAVVVAAAAVGAYLLRPEPPPEIDVSGLDPKAAEAIRAARAEVAAHGHSGAAWGKLGMVLFANDLHSESLICLEKAERLQPAEMRWPYYQGLILLLREPAAALAPLRRAADRGRWEVAPRLRLAEALLAQDRLDEAEPLFRDVLEADHKDARAHLGLGQIAYRRGRLKEAVRDLKAAADSPAAESSARAALAEVYQRLDKADAAETERRRVADLPPDPPWQDPLLLEVDRLRTGLSRRLELGDQLIRQEQPAEAVAVLREAVRQYPDSDRAHINLGRALIILKDLDGADDELREALRLNPGSIGAQFLLGGVRVLKMDDAGAAACFRKVIELKPSHALAHYNLGLCLQRQGDPAAAAEEYREALRCQPNLTDAHVALAELLLGQGQPAKARALLEDALRVAPDDEKLRQLLDKAKAAAPD
jgi:tetratricopeptide (TPR) repeat protein